MVILAKRDWLLLPFSFSSPPTFLINSLVGLSELLICKIWREPHAISRSIAEIEDFASFVHNQRRKTNFEDGAGAKKKKRQDRTVECCPRPLSQLIMGLLPAY